MNEIFEPYLTNPPRSIRARGSKLSRVMKRAAQLRRSGMSPARALRTAWAGKPNEMGVNMNEIMTIGNPRRRRAKRHNARRRVRRVNRVRRVVRRVRRTRRMNVAANPRRRSSFMKRARRHVSRFSRGMSFGGIRLPSLIDLAALGGGAVISEMGSKMAGKVHPIFDTTWGQVGAKVIIAVGGAYAIKRFGKQPKAAKMFLIGALSPVVIDLTKTAIGAIKGQTVAELGASREFPELVVYAPTRGTLGVYAPTVSELGV